MRGAMSTALTIAVTGGMGSGKTAACRHLEAEGWPVYYADDRAKSLYLEIPGLVERVGKAAGVELRLEDGSFDKAALARAAFSDREVLLRVEALVHPHVYDDFVRWRDGQNARVALLESAIFLHKPLFWPLAQAVIEVVAPKDLAVGRVMRRDGAGRADIERRMAMQEGADGRAPDAIVVNDSSLDVLYARAEEALRTVLRQKTER